MTEITKLSWEDIENCCIKLYEQILSINIKIDTIVSIQRGGCIPGVILSHMLHVDECYTIGIRTTCSDNVRSRRLDDPKIQIPETLRSISGKNVLIVDDVTNTGNTLVYAKEEVLKFNPCNCFTSVLIWDGDNSFECKADLFARHTPGWVVFPWEVVSGSEAKRNRL